MDGGGKTSASASLGGGCRLGMREKGWKVSAKESYSLIGDRVPKLIGERIKPRPEHDVGECDGLIMRPARSVKDNTTARDPR